MKNPIKLLITELALLTLVSAFSLQPLALLAQGSLTPPGAPAPTMKSLDQIYAQIGTVQDPRTVVNAANTPGDSGNSFIISQPGSYYLTTNLVGVSGKYGISIAANNVTLDLNGFAVQGVSGSYGGIRFPGAQTNVTVRNGTVNGWGNSAVDNSLVLSANVVFERLNVSASGNNGICNMGQACVVRDCNSQNNNSVGIYCGAGIISGCTVNNNGYDGIYATGSAVSGCTVNNNGYAGIEVYSGTVSGCIVSKNKYNGISLFTSNPSGNVVIGNTCIGNNTAGDSSSAGIFIADKNNRIENNHVTASGNAGILVFNSGSVFNNIIIKNTVSGNGANNYIVPAGNDLGPVGTAATATSPWANISH